MLNIEALIILAESMELNEIDMIMSRTNEELEKLLDFAVKDLADAEDKIIAQLIKEIIVKQNVRTILGIKDES